MSFAEFARPWLETGAVFSTDFSSAFSWSAYVAKSFISFHDLAHNSANTVPIPITISTG